MGSESQKKSGGCLRMFLFAAVLGTGLGLALAVCGEGATGPTGDPVADSLAVLYGVPPGGTVSVRAGVESALASGAFDAESIDVESCTAPVLIEEEGYFVECQYSGSNAFGARVTSTGRFLVRQQRGGPVVARDVTADR